MSSTQEPTVSFPISAVMEIARRADIGDILQQIMDTQLEQQETTDPQTTQKSSTVNQNTSGNQTADDPVLPPTVVNQNLVAKEENCNSSSSSCNSSCSTSCSSSSSSTPLMDMPHMLTPAQCELTSILQTSSNAANTANAATAPLITFPSMDANTTAQVFNAIRNLSDTDICQLLTDSGMLGSVINGMDQNQNIQQTRFLNNYLSSGINTATATANNVYNYQQFLPYIQQQNIYDLNFQQQYQQMQLLQQQQFLQQQNLGYNKMFTKHPVIQPIVDQLRAKHAAVAAALEAQVVVDAVVNAIEDKKNGRVESEKPTKKKRGRKKNKAKEELKLAQHSQDPTYRRKYRHLLAALSHLDRNGKPKSQDWDVVAFLNKRPKCDEDGRGRGGPSMIRHRRRRRRAIDKDTQMTDMSFNLYNSQSKSMAVMAGMANNLSDIKNIQNINININQLTTINDASIADIGNIPGLEIESADLNSEDKKTEFENDVGFCSEIHSSVINKHPLLTVSGEQLSLTSDYQYSHGRPQNVPSLVSDYDGKRYLQYLSAKKFAQHLQSVCRPILFPPTKFNELRVSNDGKSIRPIPNYDIIQNLELGMNRERDTLHMDTDEKNTCRVNLDMMANDSPLYSYSKNMKNEEHSKTIKNVLRNLLIDHTSAHIANASSAAVLVSPVMSAISASGSSSSPASSSIYSGISSSASISDNLLMFRSSAALRNKRRKRMSPMNKSSVRYGGRGKHQKGTFVCDTCGKSYQYWCNLRSHKNIHTDKAFVCEWCGKRFGRRSNCEEHRRVHTREAPFECEYCGKRFRHQHAWKDHTLSHIAKYKCKICKKRFKDENMLELHHHEMHWSSSEEDEEIGRKHEMMQNVAKQEFQWKNQLHTQLKLFKISNDSNIKDVDGDITVVEKTKEEEEN